MRKTLGLFILSAIIVSAPSASAAVLGTYKGYLNGKVFATTQKISETSALANCKLNAKNNPTDAIRCTWNNKEIFNRPATKPTKPVVSSKPKPKPLSGTYIGYMDGKVFITTKDLTEAVALANCQGDAINRPHNDIRCVWNGKEIYSRKAITGLEIPIETADNTIVINVKDTYSVDTRERISWVFKSDNDKILTQLRSQYPGALVRGIAYNQDATLGIAQTAFEIPLKTVTGSEEWYVGHVSNDGRMIPAGTYAMHVYIVSSVSGGEKIIAQGISNKFTIQNNADNEHPYCVLSTDKLTYNLNENIQVSWGSGGGTTYATFVPDTSGKDTLQVPGDKLPVSGTQLIKATVYGTPYITLRVFNAKGENAICTKAIPVSYTVQTPGNIQVLTPNGGEQWTTGVLNTVTWAPYQYNPDINPARDVTAYLERLTPGSSNYETLGKVQESGKASIHWITGELNSQTQGGVYATPGQYYIRVVNNVTGATDRSDASFTLLPKAVDLKINGSDGPIMLGSASDPLKVSWSSSGTVPVHTCQLSGFAKTQWSSVFNSSGSFVDTLQYPGNTTVTIQCVTTNAAGVQTQVNDWVSIMTTSPALSSLNILSPNGGESFDIAKNITAQWTHKGLMSYSVALYKNDKWFAWINKDLAGVNVGDMYSIDFNPLSLGATPEGEYKIYVTGQKADGSGYLDDKSDSYFKFTTPASGGDVIEVVNESQTAFANSLAPQRALEVPFMRFRIINNSSNPHAFTNLRFELSGIPSERAFSRVYVIENNQKIAPISFKPDVTRQGVFIGNADFTGVLLPRESTVLEVRADMIANLTEYNGARAQLSLTGLKGDNATFTGVPALGVTHILNTTLQLCKSDGTVNTMYGFKADCRNGITPPDVSTYATFSVTFPTSDLNTVALSVERVNLPVAQRICSTMPANSNCHWNGSQIISNPVADGSPSLSFIRPAVNETIARGPYAFTVRDTQSLTRQRYAIFFVRYVNDSFADKSFLVPTRVTNISKSGEVSLTGDVSTLPAGSYYPYVVNLDTGFVGAVSAYVWVKDKAILPPTTTRSVQVVGVYQGLYPSGIAHSAGSHPEGTVNVDVQGLVAQPAVLVLTSYEPVNWTIRNTSNVNLEKIVLLGYHSQRVTGITGVPVEAHSFVQDKTYAWGCAYANTETNGGCSYAQLSNWLKANNMPATGFTGAYSGSQFTVNFGSESLIKSTTQTASPYESFMWVVGAIGNLMK